MSTITTITEADVEDAAESYNNRGSTKEELGRYDEAIALA